MNSDQTGRGAAAEDSYRDRGIRTNSSKTKERKKGWQQEREKRRSLGDRSGKKDKKKPAASGFKFLISSPGQQ